MIHSSNESSALQFTVYDRKLDIDGILITDGLTKSPDFIVYPSEVILYPNERAKIQIQYIGKEKIIADKAYVLYSQEVPINVAEEEKDGVNLAVKMITNYYTVMAFETKKKWKMTFVSSKAIGDGKIEVIAENTGGGRVPIDHINLLVNGKMINNFTGNTNSIMPGTRRRFTFEWPKPVTAKEVKFGN